MPPAASDQPRWTVLIPAHNEAATIRGIAEGALRHVAHVIVIDDGSTDATVAALDGLPVEIIRRDRNAGKGLRLAEGLGHAAAAGADGVLTLDADGQHDPDDIPAFLAAAGASPDAIVMGDRFQNRAAIPANRLSAIRFGDFFIGWAAGRPIRDAQCGLRLYPAKLMRQVLVPEPERVHFVFETAILLRAAEMGFAIVRVPIRARYAGFVHRPSHFRPIIDTLRIVRVVAASLWRTRLGPGRLLIGRGVMR